MTTHENIEDCIFDDGLPVNLYAMTKRLNDLMQMQKGLASARKNHKIRKAMWLLVATFYENQFEVNLSTEWHRLLAEEKQNETINKR